MLLVNLNTRNAAPVTIDRQIQWLAKNDPDIVVLSEVNYGHVHHWEQSFASMKLRTLYETEPDGNRRGALVATRLDARKLPQLFLHSSARQSCVSLEIEIGGHAADLHAVYARPSATPSVSRDKSNGMVDEKTDILEAIIAQLQNRNRPQILVGDLNTPYAELEDGDWVSFAQRRRANGEWKVIQGKKHPEFWQRKHSAELAIKQPREDMACAFQNSRRQASPGDSWRIGKSAFRLDHIICSRDLMPREVWYEDYQLFTDHRPMLAQW